MLRKNSFSQLFNMAAYSTAMSLFRACSKCQTVTYLLSTNARNIPRLAAIPTRMLATSQNDSAQSQKTQENQNEYLDDFEVSYAEYKFVEQILPRITVPDVPSHGSYPTPSGWFPPNETLKAQHKFFVRRTRNHMLPVYPKTQKYWYGITHLVVVKKIEGDMWALESELRDYLQKKTGLKDIKTQVHEVSRQVRIRGLHAPLVAEFLLGCGM